MSVNVDLFKSVAGGVEAAAEAVGFFADEKSGDGLSIVFSGEKGTLRLSYEDERVSLFEVGDSGEKRLEASLLASDASASDVKYIVGEFSETINRKFGEKAAVKKKQNAKMPQTVSKNAVKHGSFYDANTLASKLCLVFPELRDEYKANAAKYGEFLSEEFFVSHGTKAVIDAIKENKPATMKKLFQILNEIYEDGTNDVQNLIAVTIMGELNNDQLLLAQCVDYMSATMAPPVIEVNRYLATPAAERRKTR